jgi:tetratricopeptide (TPR) repeat protein
VLWVLCVLGLAGCAWREPVLRLPVASRGLAAASELRPVVAQGQERLAAAWSAALLARGLVPSATAASVAQIEVLEWALSPQRRKLAWQGVRQDGGPRQTAQETQLSNAAQCRVRVRLIAPEGVLLLTASGEAVALPARLSRLPAGGRWLLDGRVVQPVADTADSLLAAAADQALAAAAQQLREGAADRVVRLDDRDQAQRSLVRAAAAGRYDEALAGFSAILEAQPANAPAAYNRAVIHEVRGELGPALRWYERAAALDPTVHGAAAKEAQERLAPAATLL